MKHHAFDPILPLSPAASNSRCNTGGAFHRSRNRLAGMLAGAVFIAAAAAPWQAAAGKGKPGGGDPPPPPPPPVDENYTAELIPIPSWVDGIFPTNMNNNGDVVGRGTLNKRGGSAAEGFIWKDKVHRMLPPLTGDTASNPLSLTDDGFMVVGRSQGRTGSTLTAWVGSAGGTYVAIELRSILLAAAGSLLPEWEFYEFESGLVSAGETILTGDGRFMLVLGRPREGNPVFPYLNNVDVVVEWDWSKLMGPDESPVVAMWVLAQPPVADPVDPERNGHKLQANSIELGVGYPGGPYEVLRVAGSLVPHGSDGWVNYGAEWPPVIWEYDLENHDISIRTLPAIPPDSVDGLSPQDVNIYGAAAGYTGYVWDPLGNPTLIEPLPDFAGSSAASINNSGTVVGPSVVRVK